MQLGSAHAATAHEHHAQLAAAADAGESDTLQARERAQILRICQVTAWKVKGSDGTARRLGLNPGTRYTRMKELGIRRPTFH